MAFWSLPLFDSSEEEDSSCQWHSFEPLDDDTEPQLPEEDCEIPGKLIVAQEDGEMYLKCTVNGAVPGECINCGESGDAAKPIVLKIPFEEVET